MNYSQLHINFTDGDHNIPAFGDRIKITSDHNGWSGHGKFIEFSSELLWWGVEVKYRKLAVLKYFHPSHCKVEVVDV